MDWQIITTVYFQVDSFIVALLSGIWAGMVHLFLEIGLLVVVGWPMVVLVKIVVFTL